MLAMKDDAHNNGSMIERILFNNRILVLLLFALATLALGYNATKVRPDIDLTKMVPQGHEYLQNARKVFEESGRADTGTGSVVRIAVAVEQGDIFSTSYLESLRKISDEVSLLPGVDTGGLLSLWTPGLNWIAVTEDGFEGGPIIDSSLYDGSEAYMAEIRENILKSGHLGSFIANDFKSSIISIPVLETNPETGEKLNIQDFSHLLEDVRSKYQADNLQIKIIGDVKKFADLTDGFMSIAAFFAVAFLITAALLYYYSRGTKSTIATLFCSIIAVIWQLGILVLFGYGVGVFSVLVPFLIFAIGISHGVQIINAIIREASAGKSSYEAARISFRHLVKPGIIALISDGMGFATLLVIDFGVIQDLAVAASVGVAVLILTNLVLLPILISYGGVTPKAIEHAEMKSARPGNLIDFFSRFTESKAAAISIGIAIAGAAIGIYLSQGLKIGDLDKGAPELRANSVYNQDNDYITTNFSTSTDEMLIFVTNAQGMATSYKKIDLLNRFEWVLQNTPGVQSVQSDASKAKFTRIAFNEGNLKMLALPRVEKTLTYYISGGSTLGVESALFLKVELSDHKEETLQRVVTAVEQFAADNNDADVQFSLGFGNGVYEAATNQVITRAQILMLVMVYGVVSFLCLITFRSWRSVLCIMLPLVLTSILCQALMAVLGIGIKVGTLPVIALGVGIGVDYGIYIFSRLESFLNQGYSLAKAYQQTLRTTGTAVFFTGLTLAIGVTTWIISPIKFQADMGVLLTFMFLWNMIGALWLLPSLARYLIRVRVVTEPESQEISATA
ncbi:MAG: MMPL family transporter [Deltaproteobacteria bacterium]|nr:MMPL family transporter [Deltaproteobacteria bacterium]